MNDEIIDNYTITPDMLEPAREHRRWNFARFEIGTAWRTTDKTSWQRAAQAARQTGKRKRIRFSSKWYQARQFGIVVRVE